MRERSIRGKTDACGDGASEILAFPGQRIKGRCSAKIHDAGWTAIQPQRRHRVRYTISTKTWTQLADVPAGKQKVKGGTDLAYAVVDRVGFVYLLKGQECEFYRYNTETGEWSRLADAPRGKTGQWLAGSWLVYDGDHCIAEYDAYSNLRRKYIYGPGVDQPVCVIEAAQGYAGTYYYHFAPWAA
jgi:hypothetical protein